MKSLSMQIRLAWRNILRNKRRTFVAGIAIGIGLASLIFVDAMIIGMKNTMLHSATASFLGEGQILRDGFRRSAQVDLTVSNLRETVKSLENEASVDAYTLRTMAFGMISSPANFSAVNMVGIDPATEPALSQIDEAIVEGSYLASDTGRQIVIGRKLAELLEVGLGDRIVVTSAQAHTGDIAQEMFRVTGVFFFNVKEMDRQMVFVPIRKAQQMLNLNDAVHQIALKFSSADIGSNEGHPFWRRYSQGGNEAVGWTVLLPQLEAAFELSQFSTLLVGIILFGVVALGIINTLFMSLYERMYEFGVLRAIGTRPLAMGRMVVFEAAALAAVAIGLGVILGYAVVAVMAHIGIDYSGIEFAGVTLREML